MEITQPIANKMEKHGAKADLDGAVNDFLTYEDYLHSEITPLDFYYLEDEKLARQVVELGLRGTGEVWKREEFKSRKAAAQASRLSKRSEQKTLASAGKELKDNFLRALAEREEANRSGKNHSIIFIRDHSACGQEISGYIDYAHRLECEDFEPYFSGKKRLLPRPTDLRLLLKSIHQGLSNQPNVDVIFYNWKTNEVASNDTANYWLILNNQTGLRIMNRKDRNIVNVDPQALPCEHSPRIVLQSDIYLHVVIFDHYIKCTI